MQTNQSVHKSLLLSFNDISQARHFQITL